MSHFAPGYHKSKEWLPVMLFVLFLNNKYLTHSKRLKYCKLFAWLSAVIHLPLSSGKKLWHRSSPVIFAKFLRTPFLQNTSGRLLLYEEKNIFERIIWDDGCSFKYLVERSYRKCYIYNIRKGIIVWGKLFKLCFICIAPLC